MKIATLSPGYRGSYIPENTPQLVKTIHRYNTQLCLIETTAAIDDQRKRAMTRKAAAGGDLRDVYKAGDVTGNEFVYSSVGQAV